MPFATWRSPRGRAAIGLLLLIGAGVAFPMLGSIPAAWYPPCPTHYLTHLHCPGCGSGRALQALTRGDVVQAFGQNVWMMTVVSSLLALLAVSIWRGLRHGLPPLALPTGTAKVVLVITLVFTLARNLPWWPFTFLAPG